MRNIRRHLPFSFLTLCTGAAATLAVVYIALIAFVMGFAALTMSFSQSVKDGQAEVATLEAQYLEGIAGIEHVDYHALGYVSPDARHFVSKQSVTALR